MPDTQRSPTNVEAFKPVPNAIGILMADHTNTAVLFDSFEQAKAGGNLKLKQALAAQIATDLVVHTTIEEEIFYPAAQEILLDGDNLVQEAIAEHAEVKAAIVELAGILDREPTSSKLDDLMARIILGVRHHVEEEETEMFAQLRAANADLTATGVQMLARKEDLKTSLSEEAGKRLSLTALVDRYAGVRQRSSPS